ncbi:hypothetical protein XELAEV_18034375mg [Xenopus laevis]|uniref:G-protein coupled receptors family 1 profile domain-containing protein n=1 Tax=Xenopus laevis TaxID=8355 RepID=A0A974CDW4_XENLA|nr:hypothetical protein XELAEV_18034375mg [Xenopus laevis]
MAYDRYVAICDPLHYIDRMSLTRRALLITATWMVGFLTPVLHFVFVSKLSFCSSKVINHFYCDATPLLQLSCSATFNVELSTYVEGILLTFNSLLLILTSYLYYLCHSQSAIFRGASKSIFHLCFPN